MKILASPRCTRCGKAEELEFSVEDTRDSFQIAASLDNLGWTFWGHPYELWLCQECSDGFIQRSKKVYADFLEEMKLFWGDKLPPKVAAFYTGIVERGRETAFLHW